MSPEPLERRYELDWIRIMAILVVFLYHTTRFFNLGNWHIKNADTYVWVEIWTYFTTLWMMPLFFIISGAGLYYALNKRTGFKKFYFKKFSRLMVPLIIATFTHSVLQVYLERITHGQFSGSFMSFIPVYFSGLYLEINGTGNFAFHGMHLWYLLFLFFYSQICYLPFALFIRNGKSIPEKIINLLSAPGLNVIIFSIPMILMKIVIPSSILETGNGGWGFIYYLWFLVAGFIIVSSDRLLARIPANRLVSLSIAVLTTCGWLYLVFCPAGMVFSGHVSPFLMSVIRYVCSWSWLLAILGYAMRFLSFDTPLLKTLNQGVLPFYILHQSVILFVGFFVMPLAVHDFLKWGMVSAGSFCLIIAIYVMIIRKSDLFKFLFGMKTSENFYDTLRRPGALVVPHLIFIGLISLAVINSPDSSGRQEEAAVFACDKNIDIVLDMGSRASISPVGVKRIRDNGAADGKALEFASDAVLKPLSDPEIYADISFFAPAGSYTVWLRGKCESGDIHADSVWLQFDRQIGTSQGRMFGNWAGVHPPDTWGWASDGARAIPVILKYAGVHRIRVQPRQVPHRLDQIWLSRLQYVIPASSSPIK